MVYYTGNDWDELLQDEYNKDYFKELNHKVNYDYKHYECYPDMGDIYRALDATSFENTKIVILGQDPYINPGQAHGLAFSVKPDAQVPPSLQNIYKEMHDDIGFRIPNNGYLMSWARNGVLLLNSILTVRRGQSRSHAGIGWERFTDAVIKKLNDDKDNLVFMLWGNYAKQKGSIIDADKHLVLTAAHPSPLAGGAFFGCKHFSKAAQYLYEVTPYSVNWDIDDVPYKKPYNGG